MVIGLIHTHTLLTLRPDLTGPVYGSVAGPQDPLGGPPGLTFPWPRVPRASVALGVLAWSFTDLHFCGDC